MQQIDRSLAESKENTACWQSSNTGFSGFQTASGQKVTLTEEALEKGTAIMQQIDRSLAESKENTACFQSNNTGFSGFLLKKARSISHLVKGVKQVSLAFKRLVGKKLHFLKKHLRKGQQ